MITIASLLLSGCATHTWAPGPNATGTYEQASAQCSLMARHSGSGFYAAGNANYVAGAAAGHAIGEAIRAQADFNDCMSASGWLVADAQVKAAKKGGPSIQQQGQDIIAEQRACVLAIRSDPKYAVLEPHHVNPATNRYSLVQMSDTNYPTDQEAALLASYGDAIAPCQDKMVASVAALDPRTAQRLRDTNLKITDLNLALIARKMTWGQYAQEAMKIIGQAPTS